MIMDRNLETPYVRDILCEKIIAFFPDFTSFDAISTFNKFRISSAPVINLKNEVIGYLSESDCIKSVSNSLYYDESRGQCIDKIMSRKIFYAQLNWDIFELEIFFISKNLRSAPVVDLNGHLVGIVTRREALMALEKCSQGREKYKREIKRPVEINARERIKMIVDAYSSFLTPKSIG